MWREREGSEVVWVKVVKVGVAVGAITVGMGDEVLHAW